MEKKMENEMETGVIWVFGFRVYIYMGYSPPIMENQMEKKMENEMETGVIWVLGFRVYIYGIFPPNNGESNGKENGK